RLDLPSVLCIVTPYTNVDHGRGGRPAAHLRAGGGRGARAHRPRRPRRGRPAAAGAAGRVRPRRQPEHDRDRVPRAAGRGAHRHPPRLGGRRDADGAGRDAPGRHPGGGIRGAAGPGSEEPVTGGPLAALAGMVLLVRLSALRRFWRRPLPPSLQGRYRAWLLAPLVPDLALVPWLVSTHRTVGL